jgi:hypothetical protein
LPSEAGKPVDASVIKAQRNRPNKGVNSENTQYLEGGYNVKVGSLKLHYGMAQARYLGKSRNQMRFGMKCLAA